MKSLSLPSLEPKTLEPSMYSYVLNIFNVVSILDVTVTVGATSAQDLVKTCTTPEGSRPLQAKLHRDRTEFGRTRFLGVLVFRHESHNLGMVPGSQQGDRI